MLFRAISALDATDCASRILERLAPVTAGLIVRRLLRKVRPSRVECQSARSFDIEGRSLRDVADLAGCTNRGNDRQTVRVGSVRGGAHESTITLGERPQGMLIP